MTFRKDNKRYVVAPDKLEHQVCLLDGPAFRHGDRDQIVGGVDRLTVFVVRGGLDEERKP